MQAFMPVRGDAGFTLIELLVVILIIGILAAIGIPALLSQRDKAKNAAAKSAVRTALTAAKTLYMEDDNFLGVNPDSLDRVEPTLYVGSPHTPSDGQQPGDTAEPKDIWIGGFGPGQSQNIGQTLTSSTPGVEEVIVLCSISKGNSIACIYNDEANGVTKFRESIAGKDGVEGRLLSPMKFLGRDDGQYGYPTAANVTGDAF